MNHFRASLEDSSHSTPSPLSSAASSQVSQAVWTVSVGRSLSPQDSLHAAQLMAQERAALSAAAAKKKGLKSSLGRIFGKKDKSLKRSGGFVTAPLSVSQQQYGEHEMVQSDSMAAIGGLAGKAEFDRRKKKK